MFYAKHIRRRWSVNIFIPFNSIFFSFLCTSILLIPEIWRENIPMKKKMYKHNLSLEICDDLYNTFFFVVRNKRLSSKRNRRKRSIIIYEFLLFHFSPITSEFACIYRDRIRKRFECHCMPIINRSNVTQLDKKINGNYLNLISENLFTIFSFN